MYVDFKRRVRENKTEKDDVMFRISQCIFSSAEDGSHVLMPGGLAPCLGLQPWLFISLYLEHMYL